MDHLKGHLYTEKQEGKGSWEFTSASLTLANEQTTVYRRFSVLDPQFPYLLR